MPYLNQYVLRHDPPWVEFDDGQYPFRLSQRQVLLVLADMPRIEAFVNGGAVSGVTRYKGKPILNLRAGRVTFRSGRRRYAAILKHKIALEEIALTFS